VWTRNQAEELEEFRARVASQVRSTGGVRPVLIEVHGAEPPRATLLAPSVGRSSQRMQRLCELGEQTETLKDRTDGFVASAALHEQDERPTANPE
jgi:hypothetical protein